MENLRVYTYSIHGSVNLPWPGNGSENNAISGSFHPYVSTSRLNCLFTNPSPFTLPLEYMYVCICYSPLIYSTILSVPLALDNNVKFQQGVRIVVNPFHFKIHTRIFFYFNMSISVSHPYYKYRNIVHILCKCPTNGLKCHRDDTLR